MSDEVPVPEPSAPSFDDRVGAVALLSESVRRSLYLHVASCDHGVSRDEAARAVGIARSLAAFHPDKLVERGLLEVTYRRLTGRSGPGSGRPAKLYRRSGRQHEVSLPPRQYELAARLLAEGLEGPRPGHRSGAGAAREFGRMEADDLEARPESQPGHCCVTLSATQPRS